MLANGVSFRPLLTLAHINLNGTKHLYSGYSVTINFIIWQEPSKSKASIKRISCFSMFIFSKSAGFWFATFFLFYVQYQKTIQREVEKSSLRMKTLLTVLIQFSSLSLYVSEMNFLVWFPTLKIQTPFFVSRCKMPVSAGLEMGCGMPSMAFFSLVGSGWRKVNFSSVSLCGLLILGNQ